MPRPIPPAAIPNSRAPPTPEFRSAPSPVCSEAWSHSFTSELLLERDEVNSPPDCVVRAANVRQMIRGEPDLELRPKVEVFLVQVTRGHGVASGRLLNRGFIKCCLLLRFRSFD